jgi:P27 family predicted phage terminase small subunit
MAGPRQPIDLVVANGRKNLTKAEIEERRATEVAPCTDDLTAPSYLTAAEKKRFNKLAEQLAKIKIMGETDTETLARYVTAQTLYEKATKDLQALYSKRPTEADAGDDKEAYYNLVDLWTTAQDNLARLQDRYFKQAQTVASSLGLTISSRCKLVVPVKDEAPKVNKFAKFGKKAQDE